MTASEIDRIGDATVTKVEACIVPFAPDEFLADWNPAGLAELGWRSPVAWDAEGTKLVVSVHAGSCARVGARA